MVLIAHNKHLRETRIGANLVFFHYIKNKNSYIYDPPAENQTCRCNFVPLCYVDFSVKSPDNLFNMIFNNERDIPIFVENVMKMIKDK